MEHASPSPPARPYRRTPKPPDRGIEWEDLKVGYERVWEKKVTPEGVAWYADLSEDYITWYGPFESPFGDPVAPPLHISRLAVWTTEPLGRMKGFANTRNFSEMFEPVFVGTTLRFHGRITDKYEKRGRRYVDIAVDAFDTATGKLVHREMKTYMVGPSREA